MIGNILDVPVILPEIENEIIGSPDDVFSDLSKTANEFGKNDYVNMYDGLTRTINYQKKLYDL
jgi:hypothetical protein